MIKKLKSFYKRNRVFSILMIISIVCIIAIVVGLCTYFLGQTSKDKYGNRLDNIKDIKISADKQEEIKASISSKESVKKANIDIKGKLIYITIVLSTGTHKDSESIAQSVLELFDEEIRNNYDIQYIFDNEDTNVTENFPVMGYIKAGNSAIKWTKYSA